MELSQIEILDLQSKPHSAGDPLYGFSRRVVTRQKIHVQIKPRGLLPHLNMALVRRPGRTLVKDLQNGCGGRHQMFMRWVTEPGLGLKSHKRLDKHLFVKQ